MSIESLCELDPNLFFLTVEALTSDFLLFEVPEGYELYIDSSPVETDYYDRWNMSFAAGEEKEIRIKFTERLYGHIFAYNTNLVIDRRIPDNHVTPTTLYEFKLPASIELEECAPDYSISTEDGRTVITWDRKDDIPWTNPFNDLICKWDYVEPVVEDDTKAQYTDYTIPLLLLIVCLALVLFYKRKKKK
jgi:hypothetical protein